MASNHPWRPSRPYPEDPPRKRPFSPPESPSRNIRPRNPIHTDLLYEQGPLPLFANFSSRGSRAIACFRNTLVRVWNVEPSGRSFLDCEHVLRHPEVVFRAATSDDGTRAVTTAGDGVARVWDLKNRQSQPKEIASQYRSTRSCDISSDAQFVAATFYTGKKLPVSMFRGVVVLYEPGRDEFLFRISVYGVPDKVKVSRDATTIAVGCYGVKPAKNMARETRITLYDRDGTELRFFHNCFPSHDACLSWDLSDDGHVLAICAEDRQAIQMYSDKGAAGWGDAPRKLTANAELTFEMCRIIDNGDLITTLALDNHTCECSVLVFRPSTGDVLFSLACGLSNRKACLDLEPRVCYAAPTYDRPGKRVVRLLSRTSGEVSTLELVRCGDPPKSAFRPAGMEFGSTSPYVSLDKPDLPTSTKDQLMFEHPSAVAHMLEDSPTPTDPKLLDRSPGRGSIRSVRTNSLPQDDKFTLSNDTAIDRIDDRSMPLRNSAGIPPSTNLIQKKRIPDTPEPDVPMKNMQHSTKPLPSDCKPISEPSTSVRIKSPKGAVKSPNSAIKCLPACNKEEKPTEPVLSPKSVEKTRENTETLSVKPTIASQSKLQTITGPIQTVTPHGANIPSVKQPEQAVARSYAQVSSERVTPTAEHKSDAQALSAKVVPTAERKFDAQALSDKQLTAEHNIQRKTNESNNSSLQSTPTEKVLDDNDEAKETTVKAGRQKLDTDQGKYAVPFPNEKKPRWQPARIRARKKMLEKAALGSNAKRTTPASTGQGHIKVEDLGLYREIANNKGPVTGLHERTNGQANMSNNSQPHRKPGSTGMNGSRDHISRDPRLQGIPASPGSSILQNSQETRAWSSPITPSCSGQLRVSVNSIAGAGKGQSDTCTPIVTASNLEASSYDKNMRKPESPAHGNANNDRGRHRTPAGFKNEQISSGLSDNHQKSPNISQETTQERKAKQEILPDHRTINSSPKTMTSPKFMQANAKGVPSLETKLDPNDGLCRNRYFEALERAKTVFHQASHKMEEEQVLSNVKAFKAMHAVIGTQRELVDRRLVAKIVYEKGGMNNTLNEKLFLEAFSHLYGEMKGVRQGQWAEVYNQASGGEGDGLLIFHARDLIKRESGALETGLNPIWNDESLDELITSQTQDGVLVDQNAFVRSTDKIFSI